MLSLVFKVAIKCRRALYNLRLMRDATLGVQVIAVGNLTVGGTGKTPVVEKFARELQDAGRKVAILSRGYRSKPRPLHERLLNKLLLRQDITPPKVVSDGQSLCFEIHKTPQMGSQAPALRALGRMVPWPHPQGISVPWPLR